MKMTNFIKNIFQNLEKIKEAGTWKDERVLEGRQGTTITVQGKKVLNFCANNYLGLANHPKVIDAAKKAIDEWGYGMSSVRFICGTQDIHIELEKRISNFLGMQDSILYVACFDANGGVFEPLLGKDDAIVTASLNHASIIDGIRLCKAKRYIYAHDDLNNLEDNLKKARVDGAKNILVATDGVFSMDGDIAKIDEILNLTKSYDGILMVDDSHATGFVGANGRGTPEFCGVHGKVDIISSTLGKALGGANGGFISAKREVTSILRQKSRPYLFSNTVAPVVAATSISVLDILESKNSPLEQLTKNTERFRAGIQKTGLIIKEGSHPIVPVMLYNARLANVFAERLLDLGVYVIGFSFPVVPEHQARIRVQISAAHSSVEIDKAVQSFEKVASDLGILGKSKDFLVNWK
tara:strand:- start:78649 stop:79875 length:1227 start_codon:yes stop_codon:yes gene_type:complete